MSIIKVFGILALAFLQSCTSQVGGDIVQMGFTPSESTEKIASNGKILSEILEKKTGLKFKTFVASDYTALVEAMKTAQVDVGWLAPFAFVLAETKANAQVALKAVRRGQANQYSAIIVKDSSAYKKIEDLKGKNIAWIDPTSSTGHIVPKAALLAVGIDPQKFFGKETWAGSHEAAVLAVMNGTVEAAATYSNNAEGSDGAWTKFEKQLGAKAIKLRSVFVSPPMPSDTVSFAGEFVNKYPEKAEKIKKALIELSESEEGKKALMDLYGIESLVEAKSSEFDPLRNAADKLGLKIEKRR